MASITPAEALLPGKGLNICLMMGSSEWIPLLPLLAHAAFAIFIKWSSTRPTRAFSILFSPHTLLRKGSERAAGWVSDSLPRSTHYISSSVSIILAMMSMGLSSPEPPPPFLKLLLSTSSSHIPSQLLWRSQCSTSACLLFLYMPVLGSFMFKYKFSPSSNQEITNLFLT